METATLLNINPKLQKSSADLTGQALLIDSFANKNTENFKSAFKHQADKHLIRKTQVKKEKELPQNGNELPDKPDKKVIGEKNVNAQQKTNNSEQSNNSDSAEQSKRLEPAETAQADSHEPASSGNSTNSDEAANSTEAVKHIESDNRNETTDSIEQEIITTQIHFDDYDLEQNLNEMAPLTDSLQVDEISDHEVIAQEIDSEQINQPVLNNSQASADAYYSSYSSPGDKVSDNILADKKAPSETVNSQLNLNQSIPSANLMAETGTKSGSDSKNESPLSKSIADFHQYIEMSKKHSMSGEAIASVKTFEQSLKKSQLNTQVVASEIKLPAGQNLQPAHAPAQSVPLARINPTGNFLPASAVQNLPSLEVKAAVGKSGWNQGFSQQIAMMASNGIQQAKIKLNPAHLGPVEATVKLTAETAVVNLSSMHLTTKEAMESAIPRLKEMLNENGFSQVDVNVSHQDKKEQQEANLDSKTGSNSEHGNSAMPGDEQLSESHELESDVQAADSQQQGLNIVDYYA